MKTIKYKENDKEFSLIPAPEMFDPNSDTRKLLKYHGITFKNDDEVMVWIAKKDIPKGVPWDIVN